MPRQTINDGQPADSVRSALNGNFTELYDAIASNPAVPRLNSPPDNATGFTLLGEPTVDGTPVSVPALLTPTDPDRYEYFNVVLDKHEGNWRLTIAESAVWYGPITNDEGPDNVNWQPDTNTLAGGYLYFAAATKQTGTFAILVGAEGAPSMLFVNVGDDLFPFWLPMSITECLPIGGGTLAEGAIVYFANGSAVKQGVQDRGFGGNRGISLLCSVGYELQWEAGRLYVSTDNGLVRLTMFQDMDPQPYHDETKGYFPGSRWTKEDGTVFICTDNTTDAAVWESVSADYIPTSYLDTDVTLAANSDEKVPSQKAVKAYVDAGMQGLAPKASVRAATTANITLSGEQTVDGVALVAGNRVLVKNQSSASANGIYVVAANAWARSADADTSEKVPNNLYVFVSEGTANADSGWTLTNNGSIVLGTTNLTFTQFSGAGQITDGAGLTKTGNVLDVNVDNSTVEISGDALRLKDGGVTAAKLATLAGTVRFTPVTSTPSGTTQTIDLNAGNHQRLVLTSTTGNLALTLTVPTGAAAGTITVYQHASTAREITVTVSSGSAFWAGTKPTFASDATSSSRVWAWAFNGTDLTISPGPVRVAN